MINSSTSLLPSSERRFKRAPIAASPLGLGLWAAGGGWGPVEEAETLSVIDAALDNGINVFDTADVYGNGLSETLLGRAMQGRRARFVVATKIGWIGYDGTAGHSAYDTPAKVVAAVANCLRRLGTDYIDILQNHIFYREANTDVLIEGLLLLQERGIIRSFGMSTGSFDFVKDFDSASQNRCASLQIDYSLLNRFPESDIFPYCLDAGIGTIIRGPLAMGILTGKFTEQSTFSDPNDHRRNWVTDPDARRVYLDDLARVEQLRALTNHARSLTQLALQFVLKNPAVTTVIPGARNLRQLYENIGALTAPPLTDDECREIDRIIAPGGGRRIWPA